MFGITSRPDAARGLILGAVGALAIGGALAAPAQAAQPPVGLGTAGAFAVLSGSTITNTGPSTISGDLGVSPGTAITGFPPGTLLGTVHAADAVAAQAKSDLTAAYGDAAGRTPATRIPGDLGGLTLAPGVYKSTSSVLLTGDVVLNAGGDPNAVFVFQIGSTLKTATSSRVRLINGASPCNVFWQVGSSATIGTTTTFAGSVLALTSITATTGATVDGRLLARNGAVTMDTNTITSPSCATIPVTPTVPGSTSTPGTPSTPGAPGTPGTPGSPGTPATPGAPGALATPAAPGRGSAILTTTPKSTANTISRHGTGRCVGGRYRAVVTGTRIKRVVFTLGRRTIGTRTHAPFSVQVDTNGGVHTVHAHITFTDATAAANLRLVFRACVTPAATTPPARHRPPAFTG